MTEDELVKLLDSFAESDSARLKVKASEELEEGQVQKAYHIGRCDIGSPYACGTPYDIIPTEES